MTEKKISSTEKIKAVKRYLNHEGSQAQIARELGVSAASLSQWISNYRDMGEELFLLDGSEEYSEELKRRAAEDYLAGEGSQGVICRKYGIRSRSSLQKWVDERRRNAPPVRGRETAFAERVEIARYCVEDNRSYAEASEKFLVSYQQARSYALKYKSGGSEALRDKRGKRGAAGMERELRMELEKLRLENGSLRAEKEKAEMEVSFLKKLGELERR